MQEHAPRGDLDATLQAVEDFAQGVQWLKAGLMQVLCQKANALQMTCRLCRPMSPRHVQIFRACPVLQILGGSKARILQSCLRPGDAVLESLD